MAKRGKKSITPEPVTQREKIWATLAGLFSGVTPIDREEYFMMRTAERIEGGGGGGGTTYTGQDGIVVDNTNHVISPDLTVLATKEDLESELDNVNPLMEQGTNYGSNPQDGDTVSGITRTDQKATGWRNITFAQLWTWIVGRASTGISSSSADTEIPTAKSVYKYITNMFKGSSGTGNGAFVYNASATAGLTIEGDYSTDYMRQVHRIGNMVTLNFCCKGTAGSTRQPAATSERTVNWYCGAILNRHQITTRCVLM